MSTQLNTIKLQRWYTSFIVILLKFWKCFRKNNVLNTYYTRTIFIQFVTITECVRFKTLPVSCLPIITITTIIFDKRYTLSEWINKDSLLCDICTLSIPRLGNDNNLYLYNMLLRMSAIGECWQSPVNVVIHQSHWWMLEYWLKLYCL